MKNEASAMAPRAPVVKPFRRISPSRYTAMQSCLLREVWTASGNAPLLPPSPSTELGSVAHCLIEAAGRGQLDGGINEKIEFVWDEFLSKAEKKMTLSAMSRHLVPLSKSIPDFQVRKLRACSRAREIAHDTGVVHVNRSTQYPRSKGSELWVESEDGRVGGYIDRVVMTKEGAILRDYKSGAVLDAGIEGNPGQLKRAYKVQMELYAALYCLRCGAWPVRLEVVPLQGAPIDVRVEREDAERLIVEACTFLNDANTRIKQVLSGTVEISALASPLPEHCRVCLFRPACQAYWIAKRREPERAWPVDVRGFLIETRRLRNGKVCIMMTEADSESSSSITIRNLTDSLDRHPLLHSTSTGNPVAIYGLRYDCRSANYIETQSTVIYGTD